MPGDVLRFKALSAREQRRLVGNQQPKPAKAQGSIEPPPIAQKAVRLMALRPHAAALIERCMDDLIAEADDEPQGA